MTVPSPGFLSWALFDRKSGGITGSENLAESITTTQSMIKSWIVSDFLRQNEPSDEQLSQAAAAIIDSDDNATESLYQAGGGDAMVERMVAMCGLAETELTPGWWSMTTISARDACRMGVAIADGRAAGPKWTEWVLTQMRNVRGSGRWGIVDGLPLADGVAIKNGWTRMADGHWDVNCLALHQDWVLAVLMGYPNELPLQVGADLAKDVTVLALQP